MILITTPEKPMLRTAKGTVRKKVTIKLYDAEIDAMYVFLPLRTINGILSLLFRKDMIL